MNSLALGTAPYHDEQAVVAAVIPESVGLAQR